jgi:tetratricopeptide (TPR) repeat protein
MLRWGAFARVFIFCLAWVLVPVTARAAQETVDTDPLNRTPEVRDAYQHFYSMDYDNAMERFERIHREHPGDPMATDYVLNATLFRELNRLDLLDTTFYANDGFLTGKHTVVEDAKMRDRIRALADEVNNEANAELKANPNNVDALFARGWSKAFVAIYDALVERSFVAGLRSAMSARGDCDKVLEIDPHYVDAELVVGVYQYVVGSLPFGFKLLVGIVGIRGSKGAGMALLRDDSEHGVVTRVEAKTSMMLFLRREARYPPAIAIAQQLAKEYPHDYLFSLEEANLEKDGGDGMVAVHTYQRLIGMAQHSGYFPNAHMELAYFGLGDTLRGQKDYGAAVEAYRQGALQPTTSPELKRRCLLQAGESYDLMGEHGKAVEQYQAVIAAGSDTAQGDAARKYMKSGYEGK